MRILLIILLSIALLLSLAALAFAVQNTSVVTVSFLLWRFESSLALVLLVAFGLGALVAILLLAPPLLTSRFSVRSMRQKLASHEQLARTSPEASSEGDEE